MSCPDNAQHLLAQLEDGIPQNVIDWGSAPPADEGTQVVIHRCKCGAFKSPNADCKRCEFLYNNLVQMGADPSTARRLVDEAATSDVGVAQRTIVETLQLSNGEATNLQGAIALYKDHNRRIGANNGTVSAPQTLPGGPNGEHSEATTNSSEEATTAYEQAKKRFLALAGSAALDDVDNLAPGYEGLQSLPFYQEFAKAQAAHRQAQGEDIQLSTEMSEGEMRDGKYTVPKRLRTSVEAVGLPKEQANILAQRFNKIGKESARRQSQRVQSRVTAILEAEGIDDPARVQQVLDVLNGRQQPQTTSGDGSTSRVARAGSNTGQKRQLSDATRQKLREAAAQRSRCKACGAFMGKTECKRCLQLRQALEEVGVAPERLNLVQTQIAGEVREIEREYRQRNRVMMIQESKDYLAEIGRGDLAMPVMQILHQQLGEAPEHPIAAQEVTPDEWVIQGARPFMNRDTFPDLSRCGFEWPEELGWNASDPEQQARNQHQLEVMAALALGSPLSSGVLHAYPGIATDNYNPNDPITEQRINDETKRLNSGEGGVWLIEKHQGNLAYCLDMMKDAVEYGQPVDPNVFHTFHYSIESLRRATPPPAITEHLQARNSTNTTADTALSPTDIDESSPQTTQTGLVNCPKCGKFANPETGCQHCGLTAEEMSTMAPENVGPEQPDHEETAEVDTPQPATATLETSAEGDSAFLAATPKSLPEVNVDDAPTAPPDTPASSESNKKKPLTPFVVMSKETGYEDGSWTWIQFPEAASLSKEAREEQYRDIFDAMKGRYRFRYSNKRKAWYAKYPISQDDIAALIADNEHPAPKQDTQPVVEEAASVSQIDNTLSVSPAIETTPPANLPDKEDPATAVTAQPESPPRNQLLEPTTANFPTLTDKQGQTRCANCYAFVSPEDQNCGYCDAFREVSKILLQGNGGLMDEDVDGLIEIALRMSAHPNILVNEDGDIIINRKEGDNAEAYLQEYSRLYLDAYQKDPNSVRDFGRHVDRWVARTKPDKDRFVPADNNATTANNNTEQFQQARCAKCKSFVSPDDPTCKRCEYYDAQLAANGSLSAEQTDTLRRLVAEQVETDTTEAGEVDRVALTQVLNQHLIDQQVPYADREAALREALLLAEPEVNYGLLRALRDVGLSETVMPYVAATDLDAMEYALTNIAASLPDEQSAALQQQIQAAVAKIREADYTITTQSPNYPRYHLYSSLRKAGLRPSDAGHIIDTLIADRREIYDNPGKYVSELEIAAGLEAGRQVTGLTEDQQPFVQAMLRNGYPLEDAVDAWGRLCYYLETPNADPFAVPEHVLPAHFSDDVQDAAYNYIDDQWAEAPSVDSSLYNPETTPPDQLPSAQTSPFQTVTDNNAKNTVPTITDSQGQARCANCYAFVSPSDPNCVRCENFGNQVEGFLSAYDPAEIAELIHSVQSIAADPQFVHGEYNAYNTERLDEIMVIERRMGLADEPDERAGFSELVREYLIESGHSKSSYLSDLASQPAATGDADADVATHDQQTGLVNCPNCGKFANPEVGCQHCGLTAEEWTTKQGEQPDESTNQTATGPDTGRNGHITQPTGGLDTGEGQGPLAGNAADNVSGVGANGKTRRRRANRHRTNAGSRSDDGLDGAGDPAGSIHADEGGMGVSTERGGLADPGQPAAGMDAADLRRRDHRIKPEDGIGEGGFKTKAQQNIEAIKLLKKLEEEDREATPEEQAILAKYVGWGGIPQCFDAYQISAYNTNKQWANEYNELKALLTPEEWESARASTPNAHYTSPTVVRAIWQALQEMGYDGGNVLEPAAGVGNFLGMMPDEIHANSKMYAVELDSISARITKKLYPSAEVRETGYEKSNLPSDYFDIVISNVPFGDYGVHDPTFTGDKGRLTKRIHNYYFAKAMDQAKPGGVVAFVTSRYTMDSTQHEYVRAHLAAQADLVGAIRLPNTAFKQNAGTEVTTDVIFLRKRAPGDAPIDNSWVNTVEQEIPNRYGNMTPVQVNEYFDQHPEMMLGTMQATGSMYRDAQPELVPGDKPLDEALQEAVARLPKHVADRNLSRCYCGAFVGEDGVCRNPRCSTNVNIYRLAPPEMVNTLQHGEYLLDEKGVLCRFNKQTQSFAPVDYQMTANGKMPTPIVRAIDCMPLKEAAKKVLALNVGHGEDAEIAEAQAELNAAYDAFVAKHGLLHKRSNLDALADDPQLPLLLSLEHYDTDTKTGAKADIFSKRIINLTQRPAHSDNAEDALLIAVYEGGINWQRMNELTGVPIP